MGVVHSCIFAPPICVRRCVRGIFPLVDRSSINEDRPLQADVDLVASWPNTCYQRTTLSRYRVCCHDASHQASILRENGMISSTGECRHSDSSKVGKRAPLLANQWRYISLLTYVGQVAQLPSKFSILLSSLMQQWYVCLCQQHHCEIYNHTSSLIR